MTDKYAVLGNPVSHSKSPSIHIAFAKQTNQDISYEAILTPLDAFVSTVEQLVERGYKGVNVTVPFKFEAYDLATKLSAFATHAGAVNTLSFSDGVILGDNTDGLGLVQDIKQNLHMDIRNKRILLLGAGGAAQGVLHPLLDAKPCQLVVANRSIDKAIAMVERANLQGQYASIALFASDFQHLDDQHFDLVINATSTGLTKVALPIPSTVFANDCLAYDMMYGRETTFMAQARAAGARVADGLGMLVEQAAEAFFLWRNVRPDTVSVLQEMRAL